MSDRIVVMDRGRIQQAGTPEEVYRRPASRFVAEFLGQCNILAARAAGSPVNGTTRLSAGSAAVPLVVSREVAAGETVEVAVRPEEIELSESAPGDGGASAARVASAAFLGDHYRYELEAGDVPLVVTSPRRFAGPRLWVRIPPAAGWVLGRLDEAPAGTLAAADLAL